MEQVAAELSPGGSHAAPDPRQEVADWRSQVPPPPGPFFLPVSLETSVNAASGARERSPSDGDSTCTGRSTSRDKQGWGQECRPFPCPRVVDNVRVGKEDLSFQFKLMFLKFSL